MINPPNSELLRAFLTVATSRNLTRASEVLGRTQSAVSMQIKRLESDLGTSLFDRGPRGVRLTARGEQLLPFARRITGLLNEATAAMHKGPLEGPVRIGIPEEYSQSVLPQVLAAFSERHPAVEVTIRCGYSAQQIAALERNELDLAVVFDWHQETTGEVLCIDPTVWVTSKLHNLHLRDPVPIAVYEPSSWCTEFAIRSLEQHGIRHRVAFSCETSSGLKMAVSAGLAIAALSRSNVPPDCRELGEADGFPLVDSSRVVLRRGPLRSSDAIDELVDMIRAGFMPLRHRSAEA